MTTAQEQVLPEFLAIESVRQSLAKMLEEDDDQYSIQSIGELVLNDFSVKKLANIFVPSHEEASQELFTKNILNGATVGIETHRPVVPFTRLPSVRKKSARKKGASKAYGHHVLVRPNGDFRVGLFSDTFQQFLALARTQETLIGEALTVQEFTAPFGEYWDQRSLTNAVERFGPAFISFPALYSALLHQAKKEEGPLPVDRRVYFFVELPHGGEEPSRWVVTASKITSRRLLQLPRDDGGWFLHATPYEQGRQLLTKNVVVVSYDPHPRE